MIDAFLHNTTKKSMAQIAAPCPNKENLIAKIEISNSYAYNRIWPILILVSCVLRVEVGPAVQPVVTAIKCTDECYCIKACPARE